MIGKLILSVQKDALLYKTLQKLPEFSRYLNLIFKKSPLQKKSLNKWFPLKDELFYERAESFAQKMNGFLEQQEINAEYVVDAYLKMCQDMLTEQIKFKKTSQYSKKLAEEALADVYRSEKAMTSYMFGLALSQFLWPNHYGMFDFFMTESGKLSGISKYLEIGPGHGLYLVESTKKFPNAKFNALDISPVSCKISEKILGHFNPDVQCEFKVQDVNDFEGGVFDYVVMCEVLEHLDCPVKILKKIKNLLHEKGHFFMTTCANCPAIDHVYHYVSVEHIRDEISDSGFRILSELALAVEPHPKEEWEKRKTEVNYAAMLVKDF